MSQVDNVRLDLLLQRSSETIKIQPEQSYREITVKLWGKGVVLRGVVSGAEIAGARRFVARQNQLIVSRIDARNGAIGLVPGSLDGAVVTNDFPVFAVNTSRVLPEYLNWLSKTADFVDLCKRASEGTTNRVRLQEERFLGLEILLPTVSEQRRIVARIEELAAKIGEARRLREMAMTETGMLIGAARRRVLSSDQFSSISLEEACDVIIDNLHSNPIYAEEGVPCVRSPDVGWGSLDLINARRTSELEYGRRTIRGEPTVGDIVFVREGGGTGKAALVREGDRFSLGQRVMLLRPHSPPPVSMQPWCLRFSPMRFPRANA